MLDFPHLHSHDIGKFWKKNYTSPSLKFSRPKYDKKLLDKWLDETSGIKTPEKQIEEKLLERIENGQI